MHSKITLSAIATILPGYHFRKAVQESTLSGTPILQASNIHKKRPTIDLTLLNRITDSPARNVSYVQNNDVVIAARGNQPGNYKAAVIEDVKEKIIATSSVYIIRIKDTSTYIPQFLSLYLNSSIAQKQLFDLTSGATIKFLSRTNLSNSEIPAVPHEVQQNLIKLSTIFTKESSLLEKKLSLTQDLLQSIINKYSISS